MDISIFLAKVIGLYMVIISAGALMNAAVFKRILNEIIHNPPLLLLAGVIALISGILLVVSHNVWSADWRVIITLVAWAALIKGIVRFVTPEQDLKLNEKFIQSDKAFYISYGITLLLGLFLCYHGFMG